MGILPGLLMAIYKMGYLIHFFIYYKEGKFKAAVIHLIKRIFQPWRAVYGFHDWFYGEKYIYNEGKNLSQQGLHMPATFPRFYLLVVEHWKLKKRLRLQFAIIVHIIYNTRECIASYYFK